MISPRLGVLCLMSAVVVLSIGPATAQKPVEQKDDLTYTCGTACQVLAIHYIRWDEAPNDPVSTRAADEAFGAKKVYRQGDDARSDHAYMVDDKIQIQHASVAGPLRKATVAS
jgi:hypothetical protein